MFTGQRWWLVAVGFSALALAQPVSAGNTSVGGVSARARSLGNAFTAVADDASAVYYNPAGLVQLERTEVMADAMTLRPALDYERSGGPSSESTRGASSPGLFLGTRAGPQLAFGLGLFAPFARTTSYETNAAVLSSHKADLVRLDLAPTAALELGSSWSIGAGLTASHVTAHSEILGLKETLRGYGFTGQWGVLYRGFEKLQLGLSYRGRMRAQVQGRGSIAGVARDHHSSALRFPDTLSGGVAWRPSDAWLVSADVDWENWSYFDRFRRDYDNPILKAAGNTRVNARDAIDLRLGIAYAADARTELRAGYSFMPRAVPTASLAPGQPDYTAHTFALGVSRSLGNASLDLGYEHAFSRSERSRSPVFPGAYRLRADFISLSLTFALGERR